MRHVILLLFCWAINFTSGYGQVNPLPSDVVSTIELRISDRLNPGIVVGIIDKNGTQYYSFGQTKEGGKKVDEHSIYEIGSISKVFTATLLAEMVRKGEIKLDDPIEKHLPSHLRLPTYEGRSITVGELSDHTSSLPRMPDNFSPADPLNPYADYTMERMYEFLGSCNLERPIGSEYEYSNLAVGLLGHILSLKAGIPYEKLMVNVIADPLDMNETRVALTKEMKKNLAYGHHDGETVPNWDLPTFAGAGGIRSSVHDMLKFLKAQLTPEASPLKEAIQLTHQIRHDKAEGDRMGLGWHIANSSVGDIYWHNGGTGGYTTFAAFNKETNKGVVVLTNSNHSVDDIGFHLLDSQSPLKVVIPHVAIPLKKWIDENGSQNLSDEYDKIKKEFPSKYEYTESGINTLGYYYLNRRKYEEAINIFMLNIREFPKSANVYDSYAEALMESGDKEQAIVYYKKSIELNPANTNGIEMLSKMGVTVELPEYKVDEKVLESYTGDYELMPGFHILITRDGNQLKGQASGQLAYEIYPVSDNQFYYKVVDAQVVFNRTSNGEVESLTLLQGGREITGKKIK